MRLEAIERLAASGDRSAYDILAEHFRAEKPDARTNGPATVRGAIMRGMGVIGGARARQWTLEVVRAYLSRGPGKVKYIRHNADYSEVLHGGLEALGAFASTDEDALRLLSSLASDARWYGRLDAGLQEDAAAAVLSVETAKAGFVSPDARAGHWVAQLTGAGEGHASDWLSPGFKTPQAARNGGLIRLLTREGEVSRKHVLGALRDAGPQEAARVEGLQSALARIENAQRRRKLQSRP